MTDEISGGETGEYHAPCALICETLRRGTGKSCGTAGVSKLKRAEGVNTSCAPRCLLKRALRNRGSGNNNK